MMFSRAVIAFRKGWLTLLCFFLLGACSSDDPREPKPLQSIKTEVKLKQVWSRNIGTGDDELQLQLRPAFIDGYVYAIDIDGFITVTELSKGKVFQKHNLGEVRVSGGFGHDSERLYFTTFEGEVVALKRDKAMTELWRFRLTSEALAAPTSNGSHVTVQTIDGKVVNLDAATGLQRWRYDSLDPILTLRGTAAPMYIKDAVLVNFSNGELLAFDAEEGSVRWKATVGLPQGRTELERLVDADDVPIANDTKLFAVAYQGKLMALDLNRGFEVWSKPASSFNRVAADASNVYVADSDGVVTAYSESTGDVVWKNEDLQYRRLSAPVVLGQTVVVADFEGYIHLLALDDGRIVARREIDDDGIMGAMTVQGDRLYVVTHSGDLYCFEYPKK